LIGTVNARRDIDNGIYTAAELYGTQGDLDGEMIGLFAFKGRLDEEGEECDKIRAWGVADDLGMEEDYSLFVSSGCGMTDNALSLGEFTTNMNGGFSLKDKIDLGDDEFLQDWDDDFLIL